MARALAEKAEAREKFRKAVEKGKAIEAREAELALALAEKSAEGSRLATEVRGLRAGADADVAEREVGARGGRRARPTRRTRSSRRSPPRATSWRRASARRAARPRRRAVRRRRRRATAAPKPPRAAAEAAAKEELLSPRARRTSAGGGEGPRARTRRRHVPRAPGGEGG